MRSSEFAIKATIADQTRNEDANWLAKNKKELDFALQAALANVDPKRLREPEGLSRGCAEFCVNGVSLNPATSVLQTEL